MANNKFKAAVRKAKGLYKSGRYKTFALAVKAAYKKIGKPGTDSSSGAGHTSTSTRAHTSGNRTSTSTKTYRIKIGRKKVGATKFIEDNERKRTRAAKVYRRIRNSKGKFLFNQKVSGVKKNLETKLGRAMVEHFKTQSIKRTKQLGKTISGYKRQLRSL
jgi:hypothetical protein